MSMEYEQATGNFYINGTFLARGYAGYMEYANDTASEHIEDHGPLPRGRYRVAYLGKYKNKGPIVVGLTPMPGTEMFGRHSMLIHGDNKRGGRTGVQQVVLFCLVKLESVFVMKYQAAMIYWGLSEMRVKFVKILSFLVGLAIMLATQVAYAQQITTPRELLDRCKAQGSVVLVRELTRDDGKEWDAVIEKIESGDPDWIYASGCLANGIYFSGNASVWLDLEVTWAELLAKAPEEVLRLEWSGVSLTKACDFPFIEPEDEFIDSHYQAVLAAFAKIDNEFLQDGKKRCAAQLKDSYERIVQRR